MKNRRRAALRAAIYARRSTLKQRGSLAAQLHECEQFARARGWSVVARYTDSASGAEKQRPMLKAMLADAWRGKFDTVVCWSIDRLGRSLEHLIHTVNELHSHNVEIVFLEQQIDTRSPAGNLILGVFGALAEFERSIMRERIMAGQREAKRKGKTLGRPGLLSPEEQEEAIALRSRGLTYDAIAKRFNHKVSLWSVNRVVNKQVKTGKNR